MNMSYVLGLDLGIASVGWSIVEPGNRIIDLGVRVFKKAETDKEGDPLNLIRRESRLSRRRLYRRAHRLSRLLNFFISSGLIHSKDEVLKNVYNENPWALRTLGLNSVLTNNQLARVIYHICKHRGFYWASSADDGQADNGKIKKSLSSNQLVMKEKGYKTVGQMIFTEYPNCQRNKSGEYSKSLPRTDLDKELRAIFKAQQSFSNPIVTKDFINAIVGCGDRKTGFLWEQKPALQGEDLLKMVGHCRFEKDELRAPAANFYSEQLVWLTKINNLRVYDEDSQERPLTREERDLILNMPLEMKSDIKYSSLTSAFEKANLWKSGQFKYKSVDYEQKTQKKKNSAKSVDITKSSKKNPEDKVFYKSSHLHEIRKALGNSLSEEWEKIRTEVLSGKYDRYNRIAYVLTVYKEDSDVIEQLSPYESRPLIEALLPVRFSGFVALSEKSLKKIIPHMVLGKRYDEACSEANYKHYKQNQAESKKLKYLPSLFSGREPNGTLIFNEEIGDIPRNPVVLRVINQTRKVVNAIVKKYGSPKSVHIELARDLSKSRAERNEIEKRNEEAASRRIKERDEFEKLFGSKCLNGTNLLKYRLYKEQDCKSMYSRKTIDIKRLFEKGYVQIDHILPYSRSYDDSQSNKVIVLTKENQDKGNQIPYEYFETRQANISWFEFERWVKSCKNLNQKKKRNLLRRSLSKDAKKDFLERNLNDTRYACRFVKNYIDSFLCLSEKSDNSGCVVVAGQLTAYLRNCWGLNKVREENDRHHALDATVIACCTRKIVQKVGAWSKSREMNSYNSSYVDPDSPVDEDEKLLQKLYVNTRKPDFPKPWECFRSEVESRVFESDLEKLKEKLKLQCSYTESELKNVRTLFVSRACEKIGKGALHGDTVYRQTSEMRKENVAVKKISLKKLKYARIGAIVDADTRNKNLCDALKKRYEEYARKIGKKIEDFVDKDIAKIFADDNPLHMPNSDGQEDPCNPIVKSVRVKEAFSGVPIRNGVAGNSTIIRVDLFKKDGKYYCIPVYAWNKTLPNRAYVSGKKETDWALVDDSFEWCFSIRQNELLKIKLKGETIFGYYNGFDRDRGSFNILLHDRQDGKDHKQGLIRKGIKTAISITKYDVDVLGNYYLSKPEKRLELA